MASNESGPMMTAAEMKEAVKLAQVHVALEGSLRTKDSLLVCRALIESREPVSAISSSNCDPACGSCFEKIEFEQAFCHMCGRRIEWPK